MLLSGKKVRVAGGRGGLEYREADRSMRIDSEMLAERWGMVVYVGSIARWAPPHEADPVTPDDVERIRQAIVESFPDFRIEWA
jgi:hypothetical protein